MKAWMAVPPRMTMGLALLVGCAESAADVSDPWNGEIIPFDSVFVTEGTAELMPSEEDPIGNPSDFTVVSGQYWVSDVMQSNIKVFDRDGSLESTIGRAGDGPGEFRRPYRMVQAGDAIAVLDKGRTLVAVRDPDGDLLHEFALPFPPENIEALNDSVLVVAGTVFSTTGDVAEMSKRDLHEYSISGEYRRSYRRYTEVDHPTAASFDGVLVAHVGDTVVSGSYNTNRIHHFDRRTGNEWWSEIAPAWYEPLEWPPEESSVPVRERIQTWLRQQKLVTQLFPLSPSGYYLAQIQVYDAENNRVYHYAIADPQGRMVALTDAVPFDVLSVEGGRAYAVQIDDEGRSFLTTFDVVVHTT